MYLSKELEKVSHLLREKSIEADEWKHKFMDIEEEHSHTKRREETTKKSGAQEKQYLQSEIHRLTELVEELKHKNSSLEIHLHEARGFLLL